MIDKLLTEANEEATHKSFCDEENGKAKASKNEKQMTVDKLQARLDTASTKKVELEQSVKELEAEIADLDQATAEATKIRTEEASTFQKESKDYREAADAVTE